MTLEKYFCPELALLRLNNLPNDDPLIQLDRVHLLQRMRDSQLPASDSWTAAQLLDSLQHVNECQHLVSFHQCDFTQVCNQLTVTLNPLSVHALELSFFDSLSVVEVPLQYMLSKVINQRCQGRKFPVVALRSMKDNPRLAKQLQQIVLCSLLGNFTISEAWSRPLPSMRKELTRLLHDSKWLTLLLQQCRSVVMYCLREQVVSMIGDHPGLQAQIEPLMHFSQFRDIVREAMAAIRDYFSRMLSTEGSSLWKSVYQQPSVCTRWVQEVVFLMQPFDAAILKISYRRPKLTFRQFLLSVSVEDSKQEEIPQLVSKPEIDAMRVLAERLSECRYGVLNEMVKWLPLFRVAPPIVALIQALMRHHYQGKTPLGRLKSCLVKLKEIEPRAFHLLHIASTLQQDAQRVHLVGKLSLSCINNQIDACQTRFGMKSKDASKPGGIVLSHLFYFVYCPICFSVYSLLADFDSVYKQDYAYGYRDSVMDYQTNQIYCQRNRHNYRGSCHKQPLKKILLLGNILSVNNRLIMLCPQDKCGRPMVLSSKCITTDRGPACCYCSQKAQPASLNFKSLLDFYTVFEETQKCCYCAGELSKTSDILVYPRRIYVCRKHRSTTLDQHVTEFYEGEADQVLKTEAEYRAEMEGFIVQFIHQREDEMRRGIVQAGMKRRKLEKLAQTVRK